MAKVDYTNFGFSGDYMILMEKKMFSRTESGKNWKSNPDEVIKKVFTPKQYNNFLSFVPMYGDRVEWGYCTAGYLPLTVTSTRPDKQRKSVSRFFFIYRPHMAENAGWLENEVMKTATEWEMEFTSERKMNPLGYEVPVYREYITLINPNETGVTHSATYEANTHTWH